MTIKKIFILLLLITAGISTNSFGQQVTYNITINYANPLEGTAEASTSHLGAFRIYPSTYLRGSKSPHKTIYCVDNRQPIPYGQLQRCSRITWKISFKPEPSSGLPAVGTTDSYYFDNSQWLLAEWENIPRLDPEHQITVCINHQSCRSLGPRAQNPLFWVWGRPASLINVSDFTINLYSDSTAEQLNKHQTLGQLRLVFDYLASIFQTERMAQEWHIVWLRKEANTGGGGLASYHGFSANYILKNGRVTKDTIPDLMLLSAHEFTHAVTNYQFPVWVNESLAEYYSYKALARFNYIDSSALDRWLRIKDKQRYADVGIYSAQLHFNQGYSVYRTLFYGKGAAFWHEVDLLLQQRYGNLDNYIHLLSANSQGEAQYVELPAQFSNAIRSIVGNNAFDSLVRKIFDLIIDFDLSTPYLTE